MKKLLVAELRSSKNLTLDQLSEMSGVSRTHINDIEHEKTVPTIEVVCKLAKALDVTLDEFVVR